MIDFRLKVFCSVAKNLSFTKASQELFITQPAISKHIQELEALFKVRLFERMGNKIILTQPGKLLLVHSEHILDRYRKLEYEMNALHNEYSGELRLGPGLSMFREFSFVETQGEEDGLSKLFIQFASHYKEKL